MTNGTIEELPSGRFRARKKHPTTGKYVPLGTFPTRPDAEHALRQPLPMRGKGPTLETLWPDFSKRRQKEIRDWRNESQRWALYIEQHEIHRIPLRDMRRKHVRAWLDWLGDRGLSPQTRKNALNGLRVALHFAVEEELLEQNPARDVRLHRSAEARSDDTWTIINPDQQLALLEAVPAPYWPAVAAALGLGLRNSEQWRLPWEDVDLDARSVTIRYSVKGKPTKTGRNRKLPLFWLGLEAFRAAEHARKSGCNWVFPSPRTNDRRGDSSHPSQWKDWTAAAKLPESFRWYDLRHTCATSLLAGWWGPPWSLEEIRQLLGHSTVKMTERYAHLLQETLQRAGARTVEFHALGDDASKSRATQGIRTLDLRFTNPSYLEGFSGLAVEEFHARSTALDSRLAAVVLEATRQAYRMGRSPMAKARVHELLLEGERLVSGGAS